MTSFISQAQARIALSRQGWVHLRTSPRLAPTGEPESMTFWNRHTGMPGRLGFHAIGDWHFTAPRGWQDAVKRALEDFTVSEPHVVSV